MESRVSKALMEEAEEAIKGIDSFDDNQELDDSNFDLAIKMSISGNPKTGFKGKLESICSFIERIEKSLALIPLNVLKPTSKKSAAVFNLAENLRTSKTIFKIVLDPSSFKKEETREKFQRVLEVCQEQSENLNTSALHLTTDYVGIKVLWEMYKLIESYNEKTKPSEKKKLRLTPNITIMVFRPFTNSSHFE